MCTQVLGSFFALKKMLGYYYCYNFICIFTQMLGSACWVILLYIFYIFYPGAG